MRLKDTRKHWNDLGRKDPLWAILTLGSKKNRKWRLDNFYKTGVDEIKQAMDLISRIPFKIKRGTALDFGCGVGRLSQALCRYFGKVYGVDIAQSMIDVAKENNKYPRKCFYLQNKTGKLTNFKNQSIDFIYSSITLQHIEPRYAKAYLKEFLRLLKIDGILVFQLPSKPALTIKGLGIRLLPRPILTRLRSNMEMYGIKKEEMLSFIEEIGGEVKFVEKSDASGRGWESYRYFVVRK